MISTYIKKLLRVSTIALVLMHIGCEVTDVSNPQTTAEDLENNASGSTVIFVNGLKNTASTVIEEMTLFAESLSDNYDNTGGERRTHWDNPRAIAPLPNLVDVGPYNSLHALVQEATFVIETVYPNDHLATAELLAESYFYRGLAYMLLGESYHGSPIEEGGEPITSDTLLSMAISDFNEGLANNSDLNYATRIKLLLARIYRVMGDKANAGQYANEALVSGLNDFIYFADYDPNTENNFNDWSIVTSWQPNPRLDFLDQKYVNFNDPIAISKIEEAFLIKAEIEISDGQFDNAKNTLVSVIDVVNSRPTVTFVDVDPRPDDLQRNNGGTRPMSGTVKFDANSLEKAGLILPRNGSSVTIPTISGTHITTSDIQSINVNTLSGQENLFYMLYLLRQEIFFAEGRRMADLGIRLPVSLRQIETNSNFTQGDAFSVVSVPSYIPQEEDMDLFTVSGGVTTMLVDVNKILTDNRASVSPFPISF